MIDCGADRAADDRVHPTTFVRTRPSSWLDDPTRPVKTLDSRAQAQLPEAQLSNCCRSRCLGFCSNIFSSRQERRDGKGPVSLSFRYTATATEAKAHTACTVRARQLRQIYCPAGR